MIALKDLEMQERIISKKIEKITKGTQRNFGEMSTIGKTNPRLLLICMILKVMYILAVMTRLTSLMNSL